MSLVLLPPPFRPGTYVRPSSIDLIEVDPGLDVSHGATVTIRTAHGVHCATHVGPGQLEVVVTALLELTRPLS